MAGLFEKIKDRYPGVARQLEGKAGFLFYTVCHCVSFIDVLVICFF